MKSKKIKQGKHKKSKPKKAGKKQKKFIAIKGIENTLDSFFQKFVKKENYRKEAVKGTVFLASFLILFGIMNFLINALPNFILNFELWIANIILAIMQSLGFNGSIIIINDLPIIELANGVNIQISYLCTGLLEAAVLLAAILASHGIAWKKRIIGALAGIVLAQLFNITRILLTITFILDSDIQTIEFVHNIFFRVTLFIVIVGIYAAWFWIATRKEK
ncbi:MAG: exosortase/archaeosortase family protein [archaeon]